MKRRTLYLACGIPVAIACFLFLTILFVPNRSVEGLLTRICANAGYTLRCTGFGKSLPVGFSARTLELGSEKGALLQLRDAKVRLELLPLLTGKVAVACSGGIGAGEVKGEVTLGKKPGWDLNCRGVRLEEIPFFKNVAEANVKGEMRLTGKLTPGKGGGHGEMQLEVKGAEVAGVKVGTMPLPDAAYREVRGALSIDKGRATLKSFTLNGDGIYVRISGDTQLGKPVGASPLNLTMEMMPKPSFLERQKFVFLLLTKYQSSPGAFRIPIRGTLAHPTI